MIQTNLKKSVVAVAMALASGYMASAGAHNIPGALPAVTPIGSMNAYDVYHTTCFSDPLLQKEGTVNGGAADHLRMAVAGVGAAAAVNLVKITGNKSGPFPFVPILANQRQCVDNQYSASAAAIVDPNSYCSSTAGVGRSVNVPGGNGEYDMVVSHLRTAGDETVGTAANSSAGTYNVKFHCENAANVHTGTGVGGPTGALDYVQIINY